MRKIIHIDADCFFAAVEMRERPELLDKPIAVGGDPGRRGVISTCNYFARRYGVHSAMPSAHAMRLCPDLDIISPNMALYKDVSSKMRTIFDEYSDLVEPLSLDEAFLDVSGCGLHRGSASLIAQEIQQRIKCELGISVSAGVSSLKYVAKIASDWRKPAGIFTVSPVMIPDFLANLPVRKLPGVGPKCQQRLSRYGINVCQDIREFDVARLLELFGSFGHRLLQMANGEYDSEVKPIRARKSVSIERTFASDFLSPETFKDTLPELMLGLESRYQKLLRPAAISKRSVKLKFEDFSQTTVETSVSALGQVFQSEEFQRLACVAWHRRQLPVRLIGLGLGLKEQGEATQLPLFD